MSLRLLSFLLFSSSLWTPVQVAQVSAQGAGEPRVLVEAMHDRLVFDEDFTRFAVGRSEILTVEPLNNRELLVLGKSPGRTSLFVWFSGGRTENLLFSVEPDYSLLRSALADIHPSIQVEVAPDSSTVVLRGLVPDLSFSRAAESAAAAYVDSRSRRKELPIVSPPEQGEGEAGGEVEVLPTEGVEESVVINLIQVEKLPALADEKIRQALEPMAGSQVTVRRIQQGDFPSDASDLFVLEGTVRDQVTLSRVLFVASRALLGDAGADGTDIRVLADEGGALTDVRDLFGAVNAGQGGGQQGIALGTVPGLGGGGGGRGGQQLVNRIGANLGRAKVIEAAAGRILAMINVENLPLVRVDVRIYEVNLTRLRQWRNDLTVLGSDFDQSALSPLPIATVLQGDGAASVAQDDLQDIFGFLNGQLTNQTQLVTGGLALENVFSFLVNEQIARALSRPTLTVLSGEQALFQVGGQVPIPVAVTVGGGTDQVLNGVQFRDFGVQLSIRPLVEEVDAETITLDLQPLVSLPDLDLTSAIGAATGSSLGTTAFETRGTRTHTRLRDGDAMMIGGLITQRQQSAQGKTPGLGDLPLAGWLFRNEAEESEDSELVIIVNPVIVRPARPDAALWDFVDPPAVLAACLDRVRGPEPRSSEAEEEPIPRNSAESNGITPLKTEGAQPSNEGDSPRTSDS